MKKQNLARNNLWIVIRSMLHKDIWQFWIKLEALVAKKYQFNINLKDKINSS
jgi:hypothetical protein